MTHRTNWRPIKFLERQSRTYGLLRSVQCHFLLVGREGAGGASEAWDVGGERERGDGAGLPAAASDGPLQWSLPCRVSCSTSGSHRRVKANGFLSWKKPRRLGQACCLDTRAHHHLSVGHQAWPAPQGLQRGRGWNEAICLEPHYLGPVLPNVQNSIIMCTEGQVL